MTGGKSSGGIHQGEFTCFNLNQILYQKTSTTVLFLFHSTVHKLAFVIDRPLLYNLTVECCYVEACEWQYALALL